VLDRANEPIAMQFACPHFGEAPVERCVPESPPGVNNSSR
jgi:hypothetical protein